MWVARLVPVLLLLSASVACRSSDAPANEGFGLIHVDALVTRLKAPEKLTVLDANGADFRAREGVIAGATLLSNYKQYDVATELPARKDTPLVFYCADSH